MAAMMHDLLTIMIERGASDLHITTGTPPQIRLHGKLTPLTQFERLTPQDTQRLAYSVLNEGQKQKFEEDNELDLSFGIQGLARFRCNVFRQRGAVAAAIRVIPFKIRTFDELNLPPVVEQLADRPKGLILVTGPTGAGKSTTLAAMIDKINSERPEHIITIEDPIEFVHRDKKGFVNQREVEVDTASFGSALRASLRQDPDTILVGEMRDLETIGTALHAAETGHLVFSTLHTLDAVETINRIISVFPPPEQKQIRLQMAAVLKAVISQRLVRKADGTGRVPAVEVLIATEYIRECIITPEKTRLIHEALQAGVSQYGMQTFDQSLYELYQQGLITYETALENASKPDDFKLRVQGIGSTSDSAREQMESAGFGGH